MSVSFYVAEASNVKEADRKGRGRPGRPPLFHNHRQIHAWMDDAVEMIGTGGVEGADGVSVATAKLHIDGGYTALFNASLYPCGRNGSSYQQTIRERIVNIIGILTALVA